VIGYRCLNRRVVPSVSLICPVAVLLVFCLAAPGAGRSLGPEQLSPRDQEARERYLAARSDFLELLRDAEQRVEASQLSLAVTYYRSAELRAERGYYSAALLDIQRAINELQRALGDALDEGLARSAERQLTRLNEMLAEAERLARNVDTDAVRRDLAQAYRELEEARRAFNEQRYRDVLNLTRRGIQMAQEALRLARRGGIEAEERIRERVAAMLRTMDELAAKAQNAPVPAGNVDIPQILAELAELASRAHAAADGGHIEAAIRLADRTTRLARLVLRQAGLHDEMPPDRLLQELEGLTNLLQRGRILVAEQPEPTALRFLDDAEADLAAAQEAIHQSEFTEAERSIREGTEKVIRALGLLGPGSSTLERHAREALQQLRGRFIPAAEDILEAQPVNDDARSYLDRARALGDQAERQIAGQQPLAALGSIRIAVELTIQAVRRAAASQLPPITEHD
jgi:hypothetical protein